MGAQPSPADAAKVLAVVVAGDPGGWFEETLESLRCQDYENLSVVVVDTVGGTGADRSGANAADAASEPAAAADHGFTARVRTVVSDAAIISAPGASSFAAAANTVLSTDLTSVFLLVCHDGVALAPDAVTTLVAQAGQSGADVAGPKLVHWDRPEVIQHVGFEVDRFGAESDMAGAEELDQEQHDVTREAFAVSTAVVLVRSDLFARLGGFDPELASRGEDVDLCWRARMAGARVVTVGEARARHRERRASVRPRSGRGRPGGDREDGGDRQLDRPDHRPAIVDRESLRTMLVNHGRISLLIFVPLALLLTAAEIAACACMGRFRHARSAAAAWIWNFARLGGIVARRRANKRVRRVRQADVTVQQYLGSLRLTSLAQRRFGSYGMGESGGFLTSAGRSLLDSLGVGRARIAWLAWALAVAVVLFGSRSFIAEGVPAVGDFLKFPPSAGALWDSWWSGWSERGTGAPASQPGGLLWLAVLGFLLEALGGSMDSVRTVWVVGPILVGLVGAYRMMAAVGSRRAQLAAMAAYLLIPLAAASIASGSAAGLTAYAAAPWLLGSSLRALGATPFGDSARQAARTALAARERGGSQTGRASRRVRLRDPLWRTALALGAAVGAAALFVPAAAGLVVVIAAGLAAGSLLIGRPGGIPRLVSATAAALLAAAVMALPLMVDLLAAGPTWDVLADGRNGSAGSSSLSELLRFAVGPDDEALRAWLLFVPMLLPLLLGRGWRLEQSVRLWMVAMAAWGVSFVSQQGLLDFGLPDVHLLLAPAAAAAAALCGMAVVSVEHDLRFSRFGCRQALVPMAAAAALLAAAGSVELLEEGRWGLPRSGHDSVLRFEPEVLSGSYRVLWIGAPEFLGVEGRPLDDGLAWATTSGDEPTIADRSVTADAGRADLIEAALDDIAEGRTIRGGRRLGGLGVRYAVLLHRLAPAPFSPESEASEVPDYWTNAFRGQLDLQLVQGVNSALTLFANSSWVPMRSLYPEGFDSDTADLHDLEVRPLAVGAAALSGDGPPWRGSVSEGTEVFVAHTASSGWDLLVDGVAAPRREALSWAWAYKPSAGGGGEMVLDYSPPWWRRAGQTIGALAPALMAAEWLRRRLLGRA